MGTIRRRADRGVRWRRRRDRTEKGWPPHLQLDGADSRPEDSPERIGALRHAGELPHTGQQAHPERLVAPQIHGAALRDSRRTGGRVMRIWNDRPPEIAHLFNPAFCALLIREGVLGFVEVSPGGMPYPLVFLLLPIVLHKATRDRFRGRSPPRCTRGFKSIRKLASAFPNVALPWPRTLVKPSSLPRTARY